MNIRRDQKIKEPMRLILYPFFRSFDSRTGKSTLHILSVAE